MKAKNMNHGKQTLAGLLAALTLLVPVVSQLGSTAEAVYDETLVGVEKPPDYVSREETDSYGSTMNRTNALDFIQKQVFGTSNSDNFSDGLGSFTGSSFNQLGYSQFAISNQETQIFETYEGASGQTSEEPAARFGAGTGFWIEETKNDKALVVFDSQNCYDKYIDVRGWTDAGALDVVTAEALENYYSIPCQVYQPESTEPKIIDKEHDLPF